MNKKSTYSTPTCGTIFIMLCIIVCWYVNLSMVILTYLFDTFFLKKSKCVGSRQYIFWKLNIYQSTKSFRCLIIAPSPLWILNIIFWTFIIYLLFLFFSTFFSLSCITVNNVTPPYCKLQQIQILKTQFYIGS